MKLLKNAKKSALENWSIVSLNVLVIALVHPLALANRLLVSIPVHATPFASMDVMVALIIFALAAITKKISIIKTAC